MNEALASFLVSPCVKITEKVSFKIASEASYVYILSRQKFIKKMPKIVHSSEFMEMRHFEEFSNNVLYGKIILYPSSILYYECITKVRIPNLLRSFLFFTRKGIYLQLSMESRHICSSCG